MKEIQRRHIDSCEIQGGLLIDRREGNTGGLLIDNCEGSTTAVKLREINEHGP